MSQAPPDWLPAEAQAAVCFSIDDIHPARSSDFYEAGGDLGEGALGHLEWLLERHPRLQATLFVTADWREISPVPTRKVIAAVPLRMMKVQQKVSGCFRSPKGADDFCRIRGYIPTLRKQGEKVLTAIERVFSGNPSIPSLEG